MSERPLSYYLKLTKQEKIGVIIFSTEKYRNLLDPLSADYTYINRFYEESQQLGAEGLNKKYTDNQLKSILREFYAIRTRYLEQQKIKEEQEIKDIKTLVKQQSEYIEEVQDVVRKQEKFSDLIGGIKQEASLPPFRPPQRDPILDRLFLEQNIPKTEWIKDLKILLEPNVFEPTPIKRIKEAIKEQQQEQPFADPTKKPKKPTIFEKKPIKKVQEKISKLLGKREDVIILYTGLNILSSNFIEPNKITTDIADTVVFSLSQIILDYFGTDMNPMISPVPQINLRENQEAQNILEYLFPSIVSLAYNGIFYPKKYSKLLIDQILILGSIFLNTVN